MSERRRKRDALRRIFQKEDRSIHVTPEPSTDTASLEIPQSEAGSSVAQVAQVQGPSSPDDKFKPPQAGVAREQASARLPEASVTNSSTTRTTSRWEEAYFRFKSRNPDLAASFEDEWTAPSGEGGPTSLEFKPSNFGAMIESKEAQRSAKQLVINCGSKSVKVREQSEKVIKFIIASKAYVSLALTAQPYASLAWSGVCLILPLAVNSSEQNAAMSGGIAKITDLLQLYRLRETLYLDDQGFSKSSSSHIVDYEQSIVNLYSQILEFQAQVIHHLSLNRLRRGLRGTFVTCPWKEWLGKIEEKDGHCQKFSSLVDRKKEDDYRLNISSRDDAFQRTLVDAVINLGGTKQDAKEEKDVELLQVLSSSYREGKDINPTRISGTCQWLFEDSEAFKSFRDVDKSSVFWLSAGPGCGKSVLSKALINDGYLIATGHAMTTQVCYFFYKDGQKGRTQAVDAVRAILHQILLNNASSQLFQEVRQQLRGFKESDMTFNLLWDALIQLVGHPEAGRIICVIDALDECESSETQKLMNALIDFFNDAEQCDSGISLKFFITSRPYDNIEYKFRALQGHSTYLSMDGNANSDAIAGDIDRVIDFEVEREFSRLSSSDRDKLREAFKSKSSRTYLWLMLTMNLIRSHRSKYSRLHNIEELLESIPVALSDAYSKLLERVEDRELAKLAFEMLVAEETPLTLGEMNMAVSLRLEPERMKMPKPTTIWPATEFRSVLENACGMFVQVYQDRVFLFHQTAREFLVGSKGSASNVDQDWYIDLPTAHVHVCKLQIDYLLHHRTATRSFPQSRGDRYARDEEDPEQELVLHFRSYCRYGFGFHLRRMLANATISMVHTARNLCMEIARMGWYDVKVKYEQSIWPEGRFTKLPPEMQVKYSTGYVAAIEGLPEVLELFLQDLKDEPDFNFFLYTAMNIALGNHEETGTDTIQMLIEAGTDLNAISGYGWTPLACALTTFPELDKIKCLVNAGADVNGLDRDLERWPLSMALSSMTRGVGNKDIILYLLDQGAIPNGKLGNGDAPRIACAQGNFGNLQALVQRGADFSGCDVEDCLRSDYYPHYIVSQIFSGNDLRMQGMDNKLATSRFLLDNGAELNPHGHALHYAALYFDFPFFMHLLEHGAELEPHRQGGCLLHVACTGSMEIVEYLVGQGFDVNSPWLDVHNDWERDSSWTPLKCACRCGRMDIANFLLSKGATIEGGVLKAAVESLNVPLVRALLDSGAAPICLGQLASCWAESTVGTDVLEMAKLLLSAGARVDSSDSDECDNLLSNLRRSDQDNHERSSRDNYPFIKKENLPMAQLLVEAGANVNDTRNKFGTALATAAKLNDLDLAQFLINNGADVNLQGVMGVGPLHLASRFCRIRMVKLLIDNGADVHARDGLGRTALYGMYGDDPSAFELEEKDRSEIAALLIQHGADPNSRDNKGATPLHYAAKFDSMLSYTRFLVEEALVVVDSLDKSGQTPLCIACFQGELETAAYLLDHGADANAQGVIYNAAREGCTDMVELLIERGADVNVRGITGDTALAALQDLRRDNGQIAKLLREKRAVALYGEGRTEPLFWERYNGTRCGGKDDESDYDDGFGRLQVRSNSIEQNDHGLTRAGVGDILSVVTDKAAPTTADTTVTRLHQRDQESMASQNLPTKERGGGNGGKHTRVATAPSTAGYAQWTGWI